MFHDFLGSDPDPENLTGSGSDQKVHWSAAVQKPTVFCPVMWIRIGCIPGGKKLPESKKKKINKVSWGKSFHFIVLTIYSILSD